MKWSKAEWEEVGGSNSSTAIFLSPGSHIPHIVVPGNMQKQLLGVGESFRNGGDKKTVSEVVTAGADSITSPPPMLLAVSFLACSRQLLYIRDICSFIQPVSIYETSAVCGKSVCSFNYANNQPFY